MLVLRGPFTAIGLVLVLFIRDHPMYAMIPSKRNPPPLPPPRVSVFFTKEVCHLLVCTLHVSSRLQNLRDNDSSPAIIRRKKFAQQVDASRCKLITRYRYSDECKKMNLIVSLRKECKRAKCRCLNGVCSSASNTPFPPCENRSRKAVTKLSAD